VTKLRIAISLALFGSALAASTSLTAHEFPYSDTCNRDFDSVCPGDWRDRTPEWDWDAFGPDNPGQPPELECPEGYEQAPQLDENGIITGWGCAKI
jgi:hypothetical protein